MRLAQVGISGLVNNQKGRKDPVRPDFSQIIRIDSGIFYNYSTIRITQSRIDKGLFAIPRSLADWFPTFNTTIKVFLGYSHRPETKNYTAYESSSHESRIGGLREWFRSNNIKGGDEVVIQLIDQENHIYRLISEHNFLIKTQELQKDFDSSGSEAEASEKVQSLAEWTNSHKEVVSMSEYCRLVETAPVQERGFVERTMRDRGAIASSLRVLLRGIYDGHCQLCNFTFLKKDGAPYFETHHINPSIGDYPKNIVVVCANCHRQFEYSNVRQEFTNDGWLRRVFFNDKEYSINQIVFSIGFKRYIREVHI